MTLNVLFSIGIIFLTGVIGATLIKYLKMPNITSYLLVGILIGPEIFNLIPGELLNSAHLFTNIALSFIAFDLGQNFTLKKLRNIGREVAWITVAQIIFSFLLVGLGMYFIVGTEMHIAILLGAIATATAPIAVIMVIREYKARGNFTDTLLGVVALDDGGGIIMFAVFLAVARGMTMVGETLGTLITTGFIEASVEIGGAVLLGIILGVLFANFPKFIDSSISILIYILGFVLINTGISQHFGFSVLLANMSMGIYLANQSGTEYRFFETLNEIEPPFYLLFFVLAGAELQFGMLKHLPLAAGVYFITRFTGKILGSYLGAVAVSARDEVKKYLGMALAPQAGVAIGFALIVKSTFKGIGGEEVFFIIIATTILNEIFGPVFTKIALQKSGETKV
ncbi:MAG: cation:proton antiporter [Elusimicrobiota bacterium]